MDSKESKTSCCPIPPWLAIIIILIVAILAGGIIYLQGQRVNLGGILCPYDEKVCADGTTVGRSGLGCEFAPCPAKKEKTVSWKTYRNDKYGFQLDYPENHTAFSRIENKQLIPAASSSEMVAIAEDEKLVDSNEGNLFLIKIEQTKMSPGDWLAKMIKKGWYYYDQKILEKAQEVTFQSKKAIQLITDGDIISPHKVMIVQRTDDLVVIIEGLRSDLFEKVISSFKFTPSGQAK